MCCGLPCEGSECRDEEYEVRGYWFDALRGESWFIGSADLNRVGKTTNAPMAQAVQLVQRELGGELVDVTPPGYVLRWEDDIPVLYPTRLRRVMDWFNVRVRGVWE